MSTFYFFPSNIASVFYTSLIKVPSLFFRCFKEKWRSLFIPLKNYVFPVLLLRKKKKKKEFCLQIVGQNKICKDEQKNPSKVKKEIEICRWICLTGSYLPVQGTKGTVSKQHSVSTFWSSRKSYIDTGIYKRQKYMSLTLVTCWRVCKALTDKKTHLNYPADGNLWLNHI